MNRYRTNTGVELILTEEQSIAYQKLEKLTLVGKAEDPKTKQPPRTREVNTEE